MPSLLTIPTSGYTRISNMFGGSATRSDVTPNAGVDTSEWKGDTDWWGHSGDVCASSASGGVYSTGNNGREHWQINKIGTSQGHYLSTEITGFKFKASQTSGAGHGIYVRRYGFLLRKKDASNSYFYDAGGTMSRGDYGTKSYSHTFTSDVLNNYLRNGWCFDEFRYQLSTQGGTGSRTTELTVYDFQFNYVGQSGKNLILPIKREYASRGQYPIA